VLNKVQKKSSVRNFAHFLNPNVLYKNFCFFAISFSVEEIDFYLPQLINMYINMPSVAEVIHPYLVARCR
jgi:hypothetical protein